MIILDITRLTGLLIHKNNSKKNMLKFKLLLIIFIMMLCPVTAHAHGPSALDIAGDIMSLNAFTYPETFSDYASTDNILDTAIKVRPSVVLMDCGKGYGEGSIYSIDSYYIHILTAYHVITAGDDNNLKIIFFNGSMANAQTAYTNPDYDIAIVKVRTSDIDPMDLIKLRTVRINMNSYNDFENEKNKEIFAFESEHVVNPSENQVYNLYGSGTKIAESYVYGPVIKDSIMVTEFGFPMLYAKCSAHSGMSGGGVFDTHGNFVGFLAGGTDNNEMVAVRLSDIYDILSNLETASTDKFSGK